jgi:hypothetical protein
MSPEKSGGFTLGGLELQSGGLAKEVQFLSCILRSWTYPAVILTSSADTWSSQVIIVEFGL